MAQPGRPRQVSPNDPASGANQAQMRAYNERLVLSLVRWHDGLSKADIARRCGLSAQTVTVIMRALESEELLIRGALQRGRVGQPSTPMLLNPEGAYGIGLRVERWGCDLSLVDFTGAMRAQRSRTYAYPTPALVESSLREELPALLAAVPEGHQSRIAGLGVAMPFDLWRWEEPLGAAPGAMADWQDYNVAEALGRITDLPVYVQNDCTAACGAELLFGKGRMQSSFAYFHIGYFLGGGIVQNGAIYFGPSGNAGALGTIRVPGPDGRPAPLLDLVSLHALEAAAIEAGWETAEFWQAQRPWSELGPALDAWIERAAAHLATAALTACSIVDFEAVFIDGTLCPEIRTRLVAATKAHLAGADMSGITPFTLSAGSLGCEAQIRGAACLPLLGRYLINGGAMFRRSAA